MSKFSWSFQKRLNLAESLCVFTGAGVSAGSGIQTFRDPGGLWTGLNPDDFATADAFERDPASVWKWYNERKKLIQAAQPNAAHQAIRELQSIKRFVSVITQNIDGLHQRSGSTHVIELHGNIMRAKCTVCGTKREDLPLDYSFEEYRCDSCGSALRPDVVRFGENVHEEDFDRAVEIARNCDLFITVGTSGLVYPAAHLPEMAMESGAYVVNFNVRHSASTRSCHEEFLGPAEDLLPAMLELIY